MVKIAPSILSADFSRLAEEVKSIQAAEWIHIDVMDGHFVPNITIGPLIVKAIRPFSKQVFDTHLMITNPEAYVDAFIQAGSDNITFHVETTDEPQKLIDKIQSQNIHAGLSLKPKTPVETLIPYLDSLDLVLVMSVEPGFGGQAFIESALDKIKWLADYKHQHQKSFEIVVDGGINETTGRLCREAGATVLVAGSYIFSAKDRIAAMKKVRG